MKLLEKLAGMVRACAGRVQYAHDGGTGVLNLEAMESRRMRSDSVAQSLLTNNGTITEFTGYALFASVQVGDNGDQEGCPTISAGSCPYDATSDYVTWDDNPWDGFDSGWHEVALVADLSGTDTITLGVGQDGEAAYSGTNCSGVSSVTIRAAVLGAGMSMEWDDVVVDFYRGGNLVATQNVGAVAADTMGTSANQSEESIATLTPAASDFDKVVVRGAVRLQAASGVTPYGDSMFGDVLIGAGSC